MLAYAINFGLPFCIWYSALPVTNLLVLEYKCNLPVLFGICKTGGFISLCLISSNESYCSFLQMNGLPFLVKSYIGFNNFCNSGQNTLKKFTIPAKTSTSFHCGWELQSLYHLQSVSQGLYTYLLILNEYLIAHVFSTSSE